jgi:hypothetical protein
MRHASPIKQRDNTCHSHRPRTGLARVRSIRSNRAPPGRQCFRERHTQIIPPHILSAIAATPFGATAAIRLPQT